MGRSLAGELYCRSIVGLFEDDEKVVKASILEWVLLRGKPQPHIKEFIGSMRISKAKEARMILGCDDVCGAGPRS